MRAALLVLALGLSACHSSSPAAPTPPPAPPVSPLPPSSSIVQISVTGGAWLVVNGSPLQMAARVYTRLNPPEFIEDTEHVTWSIDPPGAAAIDRTGRLTAAAAGAFAVGATVGDASGGSLQVRAVPGYAGNWSGEYVVTRCSGGFDFRECGRIMFQSDGSSPRRRYPFTLALSQEQDQITGTLREMRLSGDIVAPVTGLIRVNGSLVIEATVPQGDHEPFRVLNWSSSANGTATTMSGAFTQIEPRRSPFGNPYAIRTEQGFSNASRVQ